MVAVPEDPILRVENLETRYFTEEGRVDAVNDVSFELLPGKVKGIVGESGSGKSVTALSLLKLVESPGRITGGRVWYRFPELADELRGDGSDAVDGNYVDILDIPDDVARTLRGTAFGVVFQDPSSTMNPTLTVGEQIAEAVEVHRRASANPRSTRARTQDFGLTSFLAASVLPSRNYVTKPSHERAVELLDQVGIPDPEKRATEYPHQFSGGMLQRAAIAQALACEPDVLIADEPTTGLDVTTQSQFLELLADIQADTGMSVMIITHDLGVIARTADNVAVMYAGEIVERGSLQAIFDDHVHPYTEGLLNSLPDVDGEKGRLDPIDGSVSTPMDGELASRCAFADRCPKAMDACLEKPANHEIADGHSAKCILPTQPYDPDMALADNRFDYSGDDT